MRAYISSIASLLTTLIVSINFIHAQCPVTAFATPTTLYCGQTVTLTAVAEGCKPLNNNFNSGSIGTDWLSTTGAVVQNGTGTYGCVGAPPEGAYSLWMGANVGGARQIRTNNYDLTSCGGVGGTVCFDMKFGVQAAASPCEGIDLPAEGIYVQYSTNSGGSWTTLQYFDINTDPSLSSWKRYCLNIPPAAMTTATTFRWFQSTNSGAGFDAWGLDNLVITLNGPGYTYDWAHDAQPPNPLPTTPNLTPTATTTYTVTYTNGVQTCTSSVTVNVILPTATASATPTNICAGNPVQLNSTSSISAAPPTTCGLSTSLACQPFATVSDERTVGTGTSVYGTGSADINLFAEFGFSYGLTSQYIYRASELLAAGITAGKITSLSFDIASVTNSSGTPSASFAYQGFQVSMGCSGSSPTQTIATFANPAATFSTVFTPKTVTITPGMNTLFFDQGYEWDGVSNILIRFCWKLPGSGNTSIFARARYTTLAYNCGYIYSVFSSEAACFLDNSFGDLSTKRPNTTFGFCKPNPAPLVYSWTSSPAGLTSSIKNPTHTPTGNTTYTVSINQAGAPAGCAATASVNVSVVVPTVTISPDPAFVCTGAASVTLTATGSTTAPGGITSYSWSPATNLSTTTGPTTVANPTVTRTYTVTMTDASGCQATDQVVVNYTPSRTPTFAAIPAFCQGSAAPTLPTSSTNSPPITGTWSPATISNTASGTYTFTPAPGQCATTASIAVVVNTPVAPTFTAPVAVCQGAAPPALPASSNNGFAGTWNPASFSTASPGTSVSTFTPAAGACATTATLSLTVNPPVAPTFTTPAAVCQGAAPPALPASSNNGYAGTWNPTTFSTASAGTSSSTFTPSAGVCATTGTLSLTVNAPTPPTFTPPAAVCQGATPPALPASSNEGIAGTWNPATFSTATSGTSTATFTPSGGACATTATLSLTVDPPATPTFTAIPPLCVGDPAPSLPASSNEGIAGTWNPATVSTATAGTVTHTFTPSGGVCATTATLSVTIGPPATPTFTPPASVCQGDTPPSLPTSSNEGIAGTWNPTSFSTASAGTSTCTFTPSGGACATTATLSLTINPPTIPAFTAVGPFCEGDAIAPLPTTSSNGIAGMWAPATNNMVTTTYTFTPTAGLCATTASMTITINPPTVPAFTAVGPFCEGDAIAPLPTTSNNGITGTWTPVINNMATSTYTFTPTPGVCATTATLSISIDPPVTPTFTTPASVCEGATPPAPPNPSNEGITGTWAPVAFNTSSAGISTLTFTPTPGQCGTTASLSLTVDPPVIPTFNPIPPMCVGDPAPSLPASSNEGIAGTWNPATITTGSAGTSTYTFTPSGGVCATTATLAVTVGPPATPTFTAIGPFCAGDAIAPLPTSSTEGITGAWAPAINNMATTTYTFSPTSGACATTASMTITINPPVAPTFTPVGPYCVGEVVPDLATTSDNGFTGSWSPAIDNTATTAYTFTPDPGQCATTATLTIIINPSTMPAFTPPAPFCEGGMAPTLPATSNNGITGSWAPATVNNMASGTYTFTPDAGQCASSTTLSVTVNPNPTITVPPAATCANTDVVLTASGGVSYAWLPGGETTSSITVNEPGPGPYTYTITGTDANGCSGTTTADVTIAAGLTISVNPASATICSGGSVVLTASGASTYTWSPATDLSTTSGATVTASPGTTTTYTVDGESGGCVGQTTITVTVGSQITPTFTPIPAICAGLTAPVLQAPSIEGINGTWVPAVVDNTTSGTYTFTPAAGECATTASIDITVNPQPTIANIAETCDGTNTTYVVTITLSGGTAPFTVAENAPGGIGGSFAGNVWTSNPIPSGTAYDFDFTDATGCGPANASGMKNCNCATAVGTMITTPMTLCEGDVANGIYNATGENLDANDVVSYVLHTGSGGVLGTIISTSTTPNFSFAAPMVYGTTYSITAVAGNDSGSGQVDLTDPCLDVALGMSVVWYQAPVATPSSNSPLCEGATLDLTGNAVAGGTYQWTGPSAFSSTQLSPSILNVTTANAGMYTLVITANGCVSTPATTTVVINAPQVAFFNPIAPICQGAAAPVLPANSDNTPPISGTWVPSFVNTSSAGISTYTFTPNAGQCATSTTISVTVNPLPLPSATSATTCPNAPVVLNASGGTNYTWSPATGLSSTTGASVTATLSANQTYNVLVTDANGCQATTTSTVTMSPGLTVTVNPASATICAGQSVTLTASGAATYTWSPAAGLSSTSTGSVDASPAGTQIYTVTGNTSGCTGTTNVTVTVNPVPVMTTVTDITLCAEATVNAVVFGSTPAGATFDWTNTDAGTGLGLSGTGNTPSFTGNPGIATVTVTPTLNGCIGAPETFVITINALPTPTVTSNTPCENATLNLDAQPSGGNYNWSGPAAFANTNEDPAITPVALNQAGTYTVIVIDGNGCQGTASTTVSINPIPQPTIGQEGPFCTDDNSSVTLVPSIPGGTFSGNGISNGAAGIFVPSTVGSPGVTTITYTVTDANGCIGTGITDVTINALPPVNPSGTPLIGCSPLVVTFAGDLGMSSSLWNFGDGASTTDPGTGTIVHTYTSPGNYDVMLTNTLNGCTNTVTLTDYITVAPDPVADFSVRDYELSVVDPMVVLSNQSTGAATYAWDFGDATGTSTAVDPTYNYDGTPATYTITLTATSADGCVDVTQQTIVVKDELVFWVPNTFTPDGDAYNNTFQPVFSSGYDPYNFTMYIYNRWGEMVFESHNVNVGWDGTYKGEIVPDGIYTWTMQIKDPQTDELTREEGHIQLMR